MTGLKIAFTMPQLANFALTSLRKSLSMGKEKGRKEKRVTCQTRCLDATDTEVLNHVILPQGKFGKLVSEQAHIRDKSGLYKQLPF
jgi:hypothetical protein